MSQQFSNNQPPRNPAERPAIGDAASAAPETSVRQLIANGNPKVALKRAKEIHRTQNTAASETLLVEAYAARIESLIGQNLAVEAAELLDWCAGVTRPPTPTSTR